MEIRMEEKKRRCLYLILCVLALIAALFPVGSSTVMSGGIILEGIARIEEIALGFHTGQVYLFPAAGALTSTGIMTNAMNSNLWLLLPGLIYRLSENIVLAYRVYMILIQVGTLLAAMMFFQRIFEKAETRISAYFGILLYMTCPYRIYVCYDWANLSQAAAWMLLPLYAWAVAGIVRKRNFRDLLVAALTLAGIGYADAVFFVILTVLTLLVVLIVRKPWIIVTVATGGVLFLPGVYRLARYLFLGDFADWNIPLQSIMKNGYHFGQYFQSYVYREGHPGMGLGMLISLLTGLWLIFVKGIKNAKECKACSLFTGLSVFLTLLSLYYFPWDIFQRLGGWSLKLISLMETPAVFWGLALAGMCIPAACAVDQISKDENKVIAFAVPVMVVLACIGICVYQCNMLTDSRVPLNF